MQWMDNKICCIVSIKPPSKMFCLLCEKGTAQNRSLFALWYNLSVAKFELKFDPLTCVRKYYNIYIYTMT